MHEGEDSMPEVGLNLLATRHIPPRYLLARPKPSGASGGFEKCLAGSSWVPLVLSGSGFR